MGEEVVLPECVQQVQHSPGRDRLRLTSGAGRCLRDAAELLPVRSGRIIQDFWPCRASPDPDLWALSCLSKSWCTGPSGRGGRSPRTSANLAQTLLAATSLPPPRPQCSRCFLPPLSHNTIHKGQSSSRYGNVGAKSAPSSPLNPTPPCDLNCRGCASGKRGRLLALNVT